MIRIDLISSSKQQHSAILIPTLQKRKLVHRELLAQVPVSGEARTGTQEVYLQSPSKTIFAYSHTEFLEKIYLLKRGSATCPKLTRVQKRLN